MKRSSLVLLVLLLAGSICAFGQIIDPLDPLLGYCSSGCADNGTNSPTTQNPITGFGFVVDPGSQTGDLFVEVLVPGNEQVAARVRGVF